MIIDIKDIYIPSFKYGNIKITDHPYYLSLINKDKKIFNNYLKHVSERQRNKKSGTWKGFKSLKNKLKEKYDFSKGDIKIKNNLCKGYGGRHRICIMAYLNINYKVKIDNKTNIIIAFIK